MNIPTVTKILTSTNEARDIKTITFRYSQSVTPGQFFMIWIPGIDEIPMSVSKINKDIKGITFRKVGEATQALYQLKPGQKIGIRGPYGNGFTLTGKHLLFVGGGTGIAMLKYLLREIQIPLVDMQNQNKIGEFITKYQIFQQSAKEMLKNANTELEALFGNQNTEAEDENA